MTSRLRGYVNALRQVVANPTWSQAYLQARSRARARDRALKSRDEAAFSLRDHPSVLRSERDGVIAVTGADPAAYERALDSMALPEREPGDQTAWESRLMLIRILGTLVRLAPPRIAVEIGVERGYSSAVILQAMAERETGRLYSIDLPSVEADRPGFTGHVIPEALKHRWELDLGPSQQRLPRLLEQIEPVDLLLHDGDHSYDSQMLDLSNAWPRLRPGAIVVVDDVWSTALLDFARTHGQDPIVVQRADEHDGIGLLRRQR